MIRIEQGPLAFVSSMGSAASRVVVGCLVAAFLAGAKNPTAASDAVLGRYWNPDRTGQVEIYKKDGRYHGRVLSLDEPARDENNPDPELRSKPVVGMTFLSDLVFDGKDRWKKGKIYIYRRGKTLDAEAWLEKGDLKVRGYAGLWVMGKTVHMRKVRTSTESTL